MALQTANTAFSANEAFVAIRNNAGGVKAQAQNALAVLQAGSVNADFVFRMLDHLAGIVASLNQLKVISGLDSYATAQGYSGTLSADCTAAANAAQGCITWVVNNFPKDSGNIWLLSHQLNADGSRTARSFSSAQTAGLQTNLQTFIATIG